MAEKRKCKRFNIASFAETEVYASIFNDDNATLDKDSFVPQSFFMVHDQSSGDVVGYLLDISVKGLMLIGEIPFTHDTVYHWYLNYTPLSDHELHLPLDLRCAWVNNTANSDYFIAGFELMKGNPEHILKIKQLIERFEPDIDSHTGS